MLSAELKTLGASIVAQLDGHHASPNDKWMSHYLAEMMVRVERARGKKEREDAADRCCDLILRLWDKRVGLASDRVQTRIKELLRRQEWADWSTGLASLMKAGFSKSRRPPRQWSKKIELLWELGQVEDMVIVLYALASATQDDDDQDAAKDAAERVSQREETIEFAMERLSQLLPEIKEIDMRNTQGMLKITKQALQRIQRIRSALL